MMFEEYTKKEFYDGIFVGNHTKMFEHMVTELLSLFDEEGNPPPLETRKKIIEAICDAYIEQVGEQPSGVQIQRLANWLLYEDLTLKHPDKVAMTEYPFMSKRQLKTRYRRELANDTLPKTLTEQRYLGGKKQSKYFEKDK